MIGQSGNYQDDDGSQIARAMAELAERCDDLEQRVGTLENNDEFLYDFNDDECEVEDDPDTPDNDDDPIELLGDIDDDDGEGMDGLGIPFHEYRTREKREGKSE